LVRAFRDVGTVFHLAAKVSAGWEASAVVRAVGVDGTANVVEACRSARARRLVHFSSIQALTPGPGRSDIDEGAVLVEPSERARGAYDRAKADGERIVLAAGGSGLSVVVLNPTAVLGPHDFAPSPMGEFLLLLARGKIPALVAGAHCDFVDARDVAAAALAAERDGRAGHRYVLSGTRMTLVELARAWAEACGRPAPRFAVPMALARVGAAVSPTWARLRGKRPLLTADSLRVLRTQPPARCAKAERDLGFSPRPIAETLGDTWAWMKDRGWA
jgi:dihydroflavonol-4-reductase